MGSQRSALQDERPLCRTFDLQLKGCVVKEGYEEVLKWLQKIDFLPKAVFHFHGVYEKPILCEAVFTFFRKKKHIAADDESAFYIIFAHKTMVVSHFGGSRKLILP